MIEASLNIAIQSIQTSLKWFTDILDAVGGGEFYIAMVFITLACGFLLANFKVAMYVGSDAADKTADGIIKGRGKYAAGRWRRSGNVKSHGRFLPGVDRYKY